MEAYDLIQVLWVEDDPNVIATYPLKAELFGLELVNFSCWDEACEALENNFDRWSAIILDAKCKYHRDSADNAVVFLREALLGILKVCQDKGRIVPWYILTGGAESEVSDSISDERMKWDADWTKSKNKKYYSKNVDNEMLFRRIKIHANKSHRIQIQELYKEVFYALEECEISDNGYNALEDLLIPIHFPEDTQDKDYNDKYVKARTVLEYIFLSMSNYGILPEWGQVNLQWSSCLLSGMNALRKNKEGKEITVIESKKPIAPPTIIKILKEMTSIIPAFCHSDNEEEGMIRKEEYLRCVEHSTLLLKSFALQLCDIILWYKSFLQEHPKKEENAKAWVIKEPKYLNLKKKGSK